MSTNFNGQRQGTAALLLLVLMVPLLGLLAFSVDYGYLLYVKTDLQRSADQAVIAAVRDLTPNKLGNQDFDKVRATLKNYIKLNLGDEFKVLDADIEIGRYDPTTIYTTLKLLDDGTRDTVRVTVRRDATANKSVSLFFARFISHEEAAVVASATAILQRARYLGPGAQVFPFAIEQKAWNKMKSGEVANIYGDGRLEDEFGKQIPGNWGTIDIGPASNSTNSLSTQIKDGLTQNDIDSLYKQNRIPDSQKIDAGSTISLNGDTGLSAGLKHAVQDVEGKMKIAPIYKTTTGKGGKLEYEIVKWGTIEVVGSSWNGSKNTKVEIRKSFTYDQGLKPITDISNTTNVIDGAFTSPALIK